MGKKLPYICIALLALTGLGLAVVPNGMRFTGWLLLGTAAAWAAGMFVVRWGRRSRAGKVCERIFFAGLALGLAALAGIETAVVFRGEADNSAVPVDAVIVLGAGVNGEEPSAALWSRIRAAEDYLETRPDIPVVLSGGQGPGEAISEAEAMRRALWSEDGAENSRLLLEEKSANHEGPAGGAGPGYGEGHNCRGDQRFSLLPGPYDCAEAGPADHRRPGGAALVVAHRQLLFERGLCRGKDGIVRLNQRR